MATRLPAVVLTLALATSLPAGAEEIPEGWASARTPHFTFHYHPGARARVAPIVASAEEQLRRVMTVLGLDSVDPIEVRFARNTHEMADVKPGSPPPPWATGIAIRPARLVIVSLTSTNDASATDAASIFVHEVVHIAEWDAAGGNSTPVWFSEGLAIFIAGEESFERRKMLTGAALRNDLLPLSKLSASYPGDGHDVNLAYAQSADVVSFLEDRYGPGYLSAVLWRVRHGDEFHAALESLSGRSLHQIQAEWMESLDVWYRWVPSIASGTTLWVLIAFLLLAVYIRRRNQARKLYARWEAEEAARHKQMEEILWEHWDPTAMPKPSDDRSQVTHEGSTHTLH
jgi:hypothetical protein